MYRYKDERGIEGRSTLTLVPKAPFYFGDKMKTHVIDATFAKELIQKLRKDIDANRDAVTVAEKNIRDLGHIVRIVCERADLHNYPYPSAEYDQYVCCSTCGEEV